MFFCIFFIDYCRMNLVWYCNIFNKILFVLFRVLVFKQPVIEPYSRINAIIGIDPVNGASDFSSVRGVSPFCCRVIGADKLCYIAGFILDNLFAGNKIGISQPDFPPRAQEQVSMQRNLLSVTTR